MQRRNFIRNSSLASFAIASVGVASCNNNSADKKETGEKEKLPVTSPGDFVLNEITIDELQKKMQSGEYTSRSITQLYLDRIDAIDKKGPAINAVIQLNPEALSIADKMDSERKAGKVRGSMHGIPVLIKDNIDTGDSMMTTAGSLA